MNALAAVGSKVTRGTRGQKSRTAVVKHEKALCDRCSHLCVKENETCLEQFNSGISFMVFLPVVRLWQ